jgi:hypothetical protein
VTTDQAKVLNKSRVVHLTVDPSIPEMPVTKIGEESEEEETDPDRVITNSRPCEASDGLLDYDGLVTLYKCV